MKRLILLFFPLILLCLVGMAGTTQAAPLTHHSLLPDGNRTIEQFIYELRLCEQGKKTCALRTSVPKYLEALRVEGMPVTSVDDLEGLIKSGEATVAPCDWQNGDVRLYYAKNGEIAGSHTRGCYSGEMILFYNGKAALSLWCANPIHDGRMLPAPVAPSPPTRVTWNSPPAPSTCCNCPPIEVIGSEQVGYGAYYGYGNLYPTAGLSYVYQR